MLRLVLILAGVPAGLLAGLLAWMAAGGSSAGEATLASVESQLMGLRSPPPERVAGVLGVAELASTPIFPMTVGPGAVIQPSLRLDGVAVTPRHSAALLAIDGKPAQWIALGDSREGVTVSAVSGSKAVVDTIVGDVVVELGRTAGGAPADAGLAGNPTPDDRATAGFRMPPPPASAPRP